MMTPSREHVEEHYKDLSKKGFFKDLVDYIMSGPVVGMAFRGLNAVRTGRTLLGATKPVESLPGTIRGDFALDVGRNVCHGSDTVEHGLEECKHWFGDEVHTWKHHSHNWVYE